MSFYRIIHEKTPTPTAKIATKHSKMVSKDDLVLGTIVPSYEFGEADFATDSRNGLTIHDLELSNIKRLGRLGDLKDVVLQRNDVDTVINSLNEMQNVKPAETPAQTTQKG